MHACIPPPAALDVILAGSFIVLVLVYVTPPEPHRALDVVLAYVASPESAPRPRRRPRPQSLVGVSMSSSESAWPRRRLCRPDELIMTPTSPPRSRTSAPFAPSPRRRTHCPDESITPTTRPLHLRCFPVRPLPPSPIHIPDPSAISIHLSSEREE